MFPPFSLFPSFLLYFPLYFSLFLFIFLYFSLYFSPFINLLSFPYLTQFSPQLLKSNFLQRSLLTTFSSDHPSRSSWRLTMKLINHNETTNELTRKNRNRRVKMMRRQNAVNNNNNRGKLPRFEEILILPTVFSRYYKFYSDY